MRKVNLFMVAGAVTVLACGASAQLVPQNGPGPATGPQPSQDGSLLAGKPTLTVAEQRHDFGRLLDTEEGKYTFKFTNTGTGVLTITNVKPSCGCTAATPDKKDYQPGESGEIDVKYNPHGKEGKQSLSVAVSSNDPDKPTLQLQIAADVEPTVKVDPKVVTFLKLGKQEQKSLDVMVTGRTSDFAVTFATSSDPNIDVTIGEPQAVEANGQKLRQVPLKVTVRPGMPVGRVNSTIAIRTNDKRVEMVNVTAVVEILGDVEVSPNPATLGAVKGGQPFSGEVRVATRAKSGFKILGVKQREPFTTKVDVEVRPAEVGREDAYVMTIKGVAPNVKSGPLQGELVVQTDIKGEEEVKVPFYAFVRVGQPAAPASGPTPANPKN